MASKSIKKEEKLSDDIEWMLRKLFAFDLHLRSDGKLWSDGFVINKSQIKICLVRDGKKEKGFTTAYAGRLADITLKSVISKLIQEFDGKLVKEQRRYKK